MLFGLVSCACPVMGQVNPKAKKQLTEADYDKWGRLTMGEMSRNGDWVSWRMRYREGVDTLFVGHISGKGKPLTFQGVSKGAFLGRDHFAYLNSKGVLKVKRLDKPGDWSREGVKDFQDLGGGRLLLERIPEKGLREILITNYQGQVLYRQRDVAYYKSNDQKSLLGSTVREEGMFKLVLTRLDNYQQQTAGSAGGLEMKAPVWDRSGRYVAVECPGKDSDRGSLMWYDTKAAVLRTYRASADLKFPEDRAIVPGSGASLWVRADGKGVFFKTGLTQGRPKEKDPVVEVWRTTDKMLYPMAQYAKLGREMLLAYWDVERDTIVTISDAKHPLASLTGSLDFGMVWDPNFYEPQTNLEAPCDYYAVDLTTGEKVLRMERQDPQGVFPVRNSNRVVCRTLKGWEVVDFSSGGRLPVDISIDVAHPQHIEHTRVPASDRSGKWLVVQDGFDLWRFDMDSGQRQRLTFGREKGLIYRLTPHSADDQAHVELRFLKTVDLDKPLLLETGTILGTRSGYSLLLPGGSIREILSGAMGYADVVQNEQGNRFAVVAESFVESASIQVFDHGKVRKLFQANKHQQDYHWGRAEMVHYQVDGRRLNGILYCPDRIETGEKYPLVVRIYEIQSDHFFKSQSPGNFNGDGFNVANLVAEGYFVLLPDIAHGIGDPGKDARVSVDAALDAVLEKYPVDESRMGLIGHSFGGFETASIVTQTHRFAAAIAGAGVTNALSYYLTPNRSNLRPNFWRYEFQQFRTGTGFYEDKQRFLLNSPVFQAERIQTPLLLWTGQNDLQIPAEQSFNLHMGLRRLGTPSVLLVYPGQDHMLLSEDGNRDLTRRVREWFDYYLKGIKCDWIY